MTNYKLAKTSFCLLCSLICITLTPSTIAANTAAKGSQPPGKPFQYIRLQQLSLEDQINVLVGRLGSVEERLDADELLLAQLEEEAVLLQEQIDALENADSDLLMQLQDQVENNTQLIGALELEMQTLEGELATKQNLIEGTCPDGSAVQEIRPDGTVICEMVSGSPGGGTSGGYYLFKANQGIFQYQTVSPNHFAEFKIKCPHANTLPSGPVMEFSHGFSIYRSKPFWEAVSPTEVQHGWHLTLVNTWNVPRTIVAGINCQILDLHAL